MKKLLIFIILLFIFRITNSQDIEPSQQPFNYLGNPNYLISSDSAAFKQNRFTYGFIWSGDKRINNALGFNMYQITSTYYSSNPLGNFYYKDSIFNSNTDLMLCIPRISYHCDSYFPFQTESFEYCPLLKIINRGDFYTRPNDTIHHQIFGFSLIPNLSTNKVLNLNRY